MCGENSARRWASRLARGSSPRVRGKPTPGGGTWRARRAHPRVCGENYVAYAMREHRAGSSPRVRGKPARVGARGLVAGLIPACAGKTAGARGRGRAATAHPRVCGENGSGTRRCALRPGSSPRVRGKQHPRQPGRHLEGLIPACAGKTGSWPVRPPRRPAHPRVCGENPVVKMLVTPHRGSSPRVRGKQVHGGKVFHRRRLIPACAGKTR